MEKHTGQLPFDTLLQRPEVFTFPMMTIAVSEVSAGNEEFSYNNHFCTMQLLLITHNHAVSASICIGLPVSITLVDLSI